MNKRIIVAAVASALMAGASVAAEVEVLHWWTSGGEAKSVAELKKMLEAKGHKWKDFAVAGGGGDAAMTALKARVVSGNPPTAAQIKGPSIQEWAREGSLGDISDSAREWDKLLPKVVADAMKYKGKYVAAPVNVHRVNWLWINQDALNKAGGKAPANYDEFFALADKFKAQGLVAIAHGGQPWQDATVFESVVLGVGGAKFYNDALVKLDAKAIDSPTMLKSFDTLAKIKTYIDKDAAGRDWNLATAMVMNGKGGMQFMGDWAKGEFTAANKVAGKDYACVAAPGTANAYTFNIDSFAMFNVKAADAKKGQLDLATAIMSPEFQEVFNLNKGSIPVRPGVNKAKFDTCATKSMADFDSTAKSGGLEPSFAHGMAVPSATQGAIVDVIAKFMNSNMSSKDAVAALLKASKTK
ncbi:ABC transporter substrate-binding protein [Casimicrobium huifangae]|jgi:glucose/mannose transport system substrate-binding protein|uniref:ABC transporter substrate-binding protein n=1 Tax=Casimicrobium huifangae TaxID=2591109 RepID=UPI002D0179AB|nr:ABC transporter substrate-binding protein [Casimicrobium huifangae]